MFLPRLYHNFNFTAGDSGGSLICNSQVAGIVSFGFGCGRSKNL